MILNLSACEAELIRDALAYWGSRINNISCDSSAHKAAGTNVQCHLDRLQKKVQTIINTATKKP